MQDELYVRVKQALTWLKRNKGILQKDIADSMGMAEASFTRGLARIKEKRDEDFVIKFHSAVSEHISLDYLLNGIGDLVVTCASVHSRNRKAGMLMGQGMDMESAMKEVKMVVEGVYSAKAALALARKYGVEVPIIEKVNDILFNGYLVKDAVRELMNREKKEEYYGLSWQDE